MTLRKGDTGQEVITLQNLLLQHGYKPIKADGNFGPVTEAAIIDFQEHHGLGNTGVADDALLSLLTGDAGPDIFGVDVSHWQPNIDWKQVKDSNITFAYIKASEGSNRIEPLAKSQAEGAKAAGLLIGYYHFATLNDPNVVGDADSEAQLFALRLHALPQAELMPVLDIETNKSGLSPALVQKWISEFLVKMAALGYPKVMLYSYTPFLDQFLPPNHIFSQYPLWLAQYRNVAYPSLPHGWSSYTVWQYSNTGKVAGIGACDVNKCKVLPFI